MDRGDPAEVSARRRAPGRRSRSPSRAPTSGGGAGVQADLKTFAALGVYGASAITALTAQNTRGVQAIHAVPPDIVSAQIDAVLEDFAVAAIKIGMLASAAIAEAAAERLSRGCRVAARGVGAEPFVALSRRGEGAPSSSTTLSCRLVGRCACGRGLHRGDPGAAPARSSIA